MHETNVANGLVQPILWHRLPISMSPIICSTIIAAGLATMASEKRRIERVGLHRKEACLRLNVCVKNVIILIASTAMINGIQVLKDRNEMNTMMAQRIAA